MLIIRCFQKLSRCLVALIVLLAFPIIGNAQNLPNHIDPQMRMERPDLTAVPALRILAVSGFPPFSFRQENGDLVGFNIDLAKALCAELEIVCTIQAWPFEQAAEALADNQGDMLLGGLAIDAENAARFDFSMVYLAFPARIVLKSENAADFDLNQLNEKRLGVRAGSRHEDFARTYFGESEIARFDDEFEALDALRAGSVDAVLVDGMRASFWLNENGCCAFAEPVFSRPDYFGHGLAMAFPVNRLAIRRAIDYGLWRLTRNGRLHELYLRWFPVSYY